jgi:hypothetical protein
MEAETNNAEKWASKGQRKGERGNILIEVCKIWGFHGLKYDKWRLLGRYAVWLL